MTNGDRIRNMTDEELAEYIIVVWDKDDYCDTAPEKCKGRTCQQCRLEWLKKEVKE